MSKISTLLKDISQCTICAPHLPHKPRPVVYFSANSKIMIVGQAPGIRVHKSGIPWNDPSGDKLRKWMNVDSETFYNPEIFAVVPMGFCYPGKGSSGDLPPRKECKEKWHGIIVPELKKIKIKLLIGMYAQNYFLGNKSKKNLTETVRNWRNYTPKIIVMPHPSPRNQFWLKKNPWYEKEVVPYLQNAIKKHK